MNTTVCPYPSDPPGSAFDFITAIAIGVACIPFLAANGVILYYRTYPPIRAKSVDLTVLSSIGGFIWIAASLVANGHFERQINTLWSICSLWTFWLQLCFGFALWLNCLNARLYNLYRIFISREKAIKWITIPLFVLLIPIMIFCAFASTYRASRFDESVKDCRIIGQGWAVAAICFLPFYFCLFLGFGIRLRTIMSQYNEFRIIMLGGAFSCILFLLSLVILQTHAYLQVAGRCANTFAVSLAVFFYFWARMGRPVYNALMHKEEFEKTFFYQLRHHSQTLQQRQQQKQQQKDAAESSLEKNGANSGQIQNQNQSESQSQNRDFIYPNMDDPQIDTPDDDTVDAKIEIILSDGFNENILLKRKLEDVNIAHKTLLKEHGVLLSKLNSRHE